MIFGTKSRRSETITKLSHHVTARYFRIEPKHWGSDWACLRMEMYGCQPDLGKDLGYFLKCTVL